MKKVIALVLCIMMAAFFVACGGSGGGGDDSGLIKVGIINLEPSESGYREANVKDFTDTFTEANGYDAQFSYNPTHDGQVAAFRQFITDGVDYILIAAAATTGWDEALGEAKDNGIKVFLFDRIIECDEDLFEAAVISDMAKQGEIAVGLIKSLGFEEYNVIHIQGQLGSAAQEGRTGALQAEFDAGTMNLVRRGSGGDSWSGDIAKEIVEAAITAGEKFNVIYAENDGMAEGAMKALDEAGITHGVDGDVAILGFDCNTWALQYVLDGLWNFNVQCSPFQAAKLDDMIKSGNVPSKIVINDEKGFDAATITKEDVEKYGI